MWWKCSIRFTELIFGGLVVNGGQQVIDAFMRFMGLTLRRQGGCSAVYLDVKQIVYL